MEGPIAGQSTYPDPTKPDGPGSLSYLPDYTLVSTRAGDIGAWKVWKDWLVHDGPDSPREIPNFNQSFGARACVEVCGTDQWKAFNDKILEACGFDPKDTENRKKNLQEIADRVRLTYKQMTGYPGLYKMNRNDKDAKKQQKLNEFIKKEFPNGLPAPFVPHGKSRGAIGDSAGNQVRSVAGDIANSVERKSPLILDLNGDGVKTRSLDEGYIYFDHDSNGFAERTGWVSPEDGLLVLDRNQNGLVDNGGELFGDETLLDSGSQAANGFSALKELDTNANGKIDAGDAQFALLRVWCSVNADGWSQSSQLFTLDELGIQSISTSSTLSTYVDLQGNAHKQVGTFTKTDGSTGQVADVWFQADPIDSINETAGEIPEELWNLPDLQGYGNVPDLQEAMATDETGQLQSLVEQFAQEQDPTARHQIVRNMLTVWTDASQIDLNSRGSYVDGQTMRIVESFTGTSFQGRNGADPTKFEGPSLLRAYSSIHELAYGQLMAQTHFKENYDNYEWDEEAQRPKSDIEFLAEAYERFKLTGEIDPKLFQKFSGHMGSPGAPASENEMQLENLMLEMALSLTATGLGSYVSPSGNPFPNPRSLNSAKWKKKLESKLTSSLPWVFTSTAGQYSVVSRASDKYVNDSNESDYNRARTIVLLRRPDPLILDLDGDGIEMMTISSSTYFDLDGNGFAERTSWIRRDDGFLVLDRNGDGEITNGNELFGDNTVLSNGKRAANGFEALAEFDANHDDTIDATDQVFSQLRIWRDDNADGINTPDELHDLTSLGVRSVNLTSQISNSPDGEGNAIIRSGSFVREDGTQGTMSEYRLQSEPVQTREVHTVAISDEIADLPGLQGSEFSSCVSPLEQGKLIPRVWDYRKISNLNPKRPPGPQPVQDHADGGKGFMMVNWECGHRRVRRRDRRAVRKGGKSALCPRNSSGGFDGYTDRTDLSCGL